MDGHGNGGRHRLSVAVRIQGIRDECAIRPPKSFNASGQDASAVLISLINRANDILGPIEPRQLAEEMLDGVSKLFELGIRAQFRSLLLHHIA